MPRFPLPPPPKFTPSIPKKSQASLKAQQKLCIPKLKANEYLNLNKRTAQTIIKKQKHFRTSKVLLDRNKFLQYGLCGGRFEVQVKQRSFYSKEHLSLYASERYRQILYNSKNVQAFLAFHRVSFPIKLLKTIRSSRNLQTLKINLLPDQILTFTTILSSLKNLKKFHLTFLSDNKKEEISHKMKNVLLNFSQRLGSLKNLTVLKITIESNLFQNDGKTGSNLLNAISNLNIANLQVVLSLCERNILDPKKTLSFLEKVEHLVLGNSDFLHKNSSQKRGLCLLQLKVLNISDILMSCPSLQRLDLVASEDLIASRLGKAKGIKEFNIVFPRKKDPEPYRLTNLISEALKLESLSIDTRNFEDLTLVHDTLKHSRLKNYHLCICPEFSLPIQEYIPDFKDMCSSMGKIKSLEKLTFEMELLVDGMALGFLFAGLSNLKTLSIIIQSKYEESMFPFECLNLLKSLEELEIYYPDLQKAEALERLPKMPKLKNLRVQQRKDVNNEMIQMSDYKQKFGL